MSLKNLRTLFIFELFDTDNSHEIDRLEFRNIITCFVEMILTCKFDSEGIQERIKLLNTDAMNSLLIEKALDQYVDEIFGKYSYNKDFLTFNEWSNWFLTINGVDKILDFTGILKY